MKDRNEQYLKEIARNTAEIAKELKKINRRNPMINMKIGEKQREDLRKWNETKDKQTTEGSDALLIQALKLIKEVVWAMMTNNNLSAMPVS